MMSEASANARNLTKSRAWVVFAYLLATAVGAAIAATPTLTGFATDEPLARAAIADVAATLVIFAFSFAFRNSSFYDAYWSVLPPALGVYWVLAAPAGIDRVRVCLALGLCAVWGIRLTYNWARGWTGLDHEDWRYRDLAKKSGKAYWLVSFFGIHFFPTVQTFAGSVGLYVALTYGGRSFGALDVVATLVTGGAIACETIADKQLHDFKRRKGTAPGETIREGLWAYSRHPNYFGEMSFWWGLFLFGIAAAPERWAWMIGGPVAITGMFFFVSIPLMEKRQLERRPQFAEHVKTTSMIIPWFRKSA
jgi:steroid 5-alpha reductase family enzyme